MKAFHLCSYLSLVLVVAAIYIKYFTETMALKLFKRGEKAPKEPKAPKELSPKRSFFKRVPKKEEIVEEPVKVIEEVRAAN